MGDYALAAIIIALGLASIWFGVTQPRGDAWGKAWQYVFGGAIFTVIGAVFLASTLGWL